MSIICVICASCLVSIISSLHLLSTNFIVILILEDLGYVTSILIISVVVCLPPSHLLYYTNLLLKLSIDSSLKKLIAEFIPFIYNYTREPVCLFFLSFTFNFIKLQPCISSALIVSLLMAAFPIHSA